MFKFNKIEKSWILYDVACSAFILTLTAIIPVFFRGLIDLNGIENVANNPIVNTIFHKNAVLALHGNTQAIEALKTSIFALSTTIAVFIAALSAPLIGALADYEGIKKKFFILSLILGVSSCFLLSFITDWFIFLLVLIFARIAYSAGNIFYDSMLTDVANNERMDFLSSAGYAWGYIGSCIPFILGIIFIVFKPFGINSLKAAQISFFITAVWWGLLSLPLIKNYKQIHYIDNQPHKVKKACSRLKLTLKKLTNNPILLLFMIAYFCYIDGVNTIINMATTYGAEVGLKSNDMIIALLVTQFVAFPCALYTGKMADKYDSLHILRFLILVYIGICLYAYQMDTQDEFWVLCFLVGSVQGGIQAISRSYFGKLIPKEESNEYFGFFDIFGKFSDFLGPLIMTICTSLMGASKYGVIALIILFIIGYLLLTKIYYIQKKKA